MPRTEVNMKDKDFLANLKAYQPCIEAFMWAKQFDTWENLWAECDRGDWMLWIISRTCGEKDRIVTIACECARLALPYTKDPRVLKCIEVTEAWVRGEATIGQVREARRADAYAYAAAYDAAYAATDAADAYAAAYDAAYAATAAYAAATAADADATAADAAAAAADAADAADAAAYADAAAADADARKKTLKTCADIVRRHYPTPPQLKEVQ